jgi:hypothetical protein
MIKAAGGHLGTSHVVDFIVYTSLDDLDLDKEIFVIKALDLPPQGRISVSCDHTQCF